MYQEDKVTAEQRHNTLAAKFEKLSHQVTTTRQESLSDHEGENSRRDSSETHLHDCKNHEEKAKSFVPKFSKMDFPIYDKVYTQGLSYNCDKVYTQGDGCKRLFLLEGIEEIVDEVQTIANEENDM